MKDHAGPTVVFIDSSTWEPFTSLAVALRNSGIGVARITARRNEFFSRTVQRVEQTIFGSTQQLVVRPDDPEAAVRIDCESLDSVLPEGTVDIQAPDHIAMQVLRSGDPAGRFLRRVAPDVDPYLLFDKWRAKNLCNELGVPTPRGWESPDCDSFPIVVKSRIGSGGDGVRIAHDQEQLNEYWAELTDSDGRSPFLEEFHATADLHFGGVAKDGELLVGTAFRGLPEPTDPLGPPRTCEAVDEPDIVEGVRKIVKATRYTGFINLDYVTDDAGFALAIDINARVFGTWPPLQESGVDMFGAYLFALDLGPRPKPSEISYNVDHMIFSFPLPDAASPRDLWRRQSADLKIINGRRKWLGNRWAVVTAMRVEAFALKQVIKRPWARN